MNHRVRRFNYFVIRALSKRVGIALAVAISPQRFLSPRQDQCRYHPSILSHIAGRRPMHQALPMG
jgi:hypothetical protein